MNKKSQEAMEFLIIYGWAILVVLVAIGGLWYTGVLYPDRFLPDLCKCHFMDFDYEYNTFLDNETLYIECSNVTQWIDYENKKIEHSEEVYLYQCVNKTMVLI